MRLSVPPASMSMEPGQISSELGDFYRFLIFRLFMRSDWAPLVLTIGNLLHISLLCAQLIDR